VPHGSKPCMLSLHHTPIVFLLLLFLVILTGLEPVPNPFQGFMLTNYTTEPYFITYYTNNLLLTYFVIKILTLAKTKKTPFYWCLSVICFKVIYVLHAFYSLFAYFFNQNNTSSLSKKLEKLLKGKLLLVSVVSVHFVSFYIV
jgi:hypothetical protein